MNSLASELVSAIVASDIAEWVAFQTKRGRPPSKQEVAVYRRYLEQADERLERELARLDALAVRRAGDGPQVHSVALSGGRAPRPPRSAKAAATVAPSAEDGPPPGSRLDEIARLLCEALAGGQR
jgi:hypothetical protein